MIPIRGLDLASKQAYHRSRDAMTKTPVPRVMKSGVLLVLLSVPGLAFKQDIHKAITESVLGELGFDADSRDEVGDANWWTDVLEPNDSAAHFDNENLAGGAERLRRLKAEIIASLRACDREGAQEKLGRALHTLQDFYSHSNAVNNNFLAMDPGSIEQNPPSSLVCAWPSFSPGGLTSGYFSLGGWLHWNECSTTPPNKCCHRDLNKDDDDRPGFGAARGAAVIATRNFMRELELEMKSQLGEEAGRYLFRMLARKQRQVAFVIDDTGSMYDDIASVKSLISRQLDLLTASDESPVLNLITFKDDVTDRGRSCDLNLFRSQIQSLFASGGGDCPEASMSALLRGISKVGYGGQAILATDASARDYGLGPAVYAAASNKSVKIDAILTGDCVSFSETVAGSPSRGATPPLREREGEWNQALEGELTSPSARRQLAALTALTGGVLIQASSAEAGQAAEILLEARKPDAAFLFGGVYEMTAGSVVTVPVMIDRTVTSVQFVLNAAGGILPSFQITTPAGAAVTAGSPGVQITSISGVQSYRILSPQPGQWTVRLAGAGRVSLQVIASSAFRLSGGVRYLSRDVSGERPEVTTKPLSGQPVAGQPVLAELRFSEEPLGVTVQLVRPDGQLIQEIPAQRVAPRYFQFRFVPPGEEFLVVSRGLGPSGDTFQRAVEQRFRAQTFRVEGPGSLRAPLGAATSFRVGVENFGPGRTFSVSAVSARGFPIEAPPTISVGPSSSTSFNVTVNIPAAAPGVHDDQITIVLMDPGNPLAQNSASVRVDVIENHAPDCSRATISLEEELWPPNGKLVRGRISGVVDPDGDPVSIEVLSINQSQPTLSTAAGSGRSCPDAGIIGPNLFELRSERDGTGEGRQYRVTFRATDSKGGSCQAAVSLCVPHDKGKPLCKEPETPYDSTRCP
jgi:hypothetical protein